MCNVHVHAHAHVACAGACTSTSMYIYAQVTSALLASAVDEPISRPRDDFSPPEVRLGRRMRLGPCMFIQNTPCQTLIIPPSDVHVGSPLL